MPNARVELTWRWTTIEMRMSDLLVLRRTVEAYADTSGAHSASSVMVWLNEFVLHFSSYEFQDFRTLVIDSAENLPRQTVRWADLKVRIEPHNPAYHNGQTQLSLS